jgi:Predicted permeases
MYFIKSLFELTCQMSPYLLLGFLIAGILHVFVPGRIYTKYLAGNNFHSVINAALLGVPLPLCSCGVIPTAMSLRKEKASKGAVTSFLIATPQTGIDSILATYSLLGLAFAILRPVAAFVTGILGGCLVNKFTTKDTLAQSTACQTKEIHHNKLLAVLKYSFVDMIQDIGARLLLGLLIAALITVAIPDSFFLQFTAYPLLEMIIILIVAIPMYICSTGSIPIAAALMLKGVSPGAAFVLLMAGPATNIASLLVIKKSLGTKTLLLYLLSIIAGAIGFGFVTDYFLQAKTFGIFAKAAMCGDCCASSPSLISIISSILLTIFILNAFIMKLFGKKKEEVKEGCILYKVEGMHCSHCKESIEKGISKLDGVKSVKANFNNGNVIVEGVADKQELKKTIEELGFTFNGQQNK